MPEKTAKEIFAENLQYYMELNNVKQVDLVNYFKLGKSTISSWCTGLKMPRSDKLEKLAEFFNIELSDLLQKRIGTSNIPIAHKIPVLGNVAAGIPLEAIEDIVDYEEISEDLASRGQFFGLKIKGSSMEPRIKDGDVVIVRQQPDVESGDVAIVLVNGDSATCKKVVINDNGITLIPFNPTYEPKFYSAEQVESLPVRIIGKVIELRGKF